MVYKVACANGKGIKKTSTMRPKSIRNSMTNRYTNHVLFKPFLGPPFSHFFLIFVQKRSIWGPPWKSNGVKNGTKIRQVARKIEKSNLPGCPGSVPNSGSTSRSISYRFLVALCSLFADFGADAKRFGTILRVKVQPFRNLPRSARICQESARICQESAKNQLVNDCIHAPSSHTLAP